MFKITHTRHFGRTFCLILSCTVLLNSGAYLIICTASHVTKMCFRYMQSIATYMKRNWDKSFSLATGYDLEIGEWVSCPIMQ